MIPPRGATYRQCGYNFVNTMPWGREYNGIGESSNPSFASLSSLDALQHAPSQVGTSPIATNCRGRPCPASKIGNDHNAGGTQRSNPVPPQLARKSSTSCCCFWGVVHEWPHRWHCHDNAAARTADRSVDISPRLKKE